MKDNAVQGTEQPETKPSEKPENMKTDLRVERVSAMRGRISGLRALRMAQSAAKPEEKSEPSSFDQDEEPVLLLHPANESKSLSAGALRHQLTTLAGLMISVVWLSYCAAYAFKFGDTFMMTPPELGAYAAGALAPLALFWIIISAVNRRSDVEMYSRALRGELQSLLFPSSESAKLINQDVERMVRQAAEISAASKAVLKSLQRARQGLRVEIRDFSGVSKKTEFHIDRLAENLAERTAKLGSLMEELEQRAANIDEKTKEGAEAWDQATLTVLTRAGEIESAMGKGADKILEAADKAKDKTGEIRAHLEGSYDSLNASVGEIALKLESLSTKFDEHTESLGEAANRVTQETGRLGSMIRDQVEDLEDITEKTISSLSRSADLIKDQRNSLDDGAKAVADQAGKIAETIQGSVGKLESTVEDMTAKGEALEQRLETGAKSLQETIKSVSQEAAVIEQAGTYASNKLTEALSVAVSGAESISSAVRRSVESLEKSTQAAKDQAESLISTTQKHIRDLNESGEGNVEHIRAIVDMLKSSASQIEKVSEVARLSLTEFSGLIDEQNEKINLAGRSLSERVDSIRGTLERPLRDINAAVSDADTRHQQIEDTLRRRVADLNESSEKATQSAENIRTILRGQAQEISTLSGQIAGNARTINEQMTIQKDTLTAQVKDSLSRITQVGEALAKESSALHRVATGATEDITALSGHITSRCQEVGEISGKAVSGLREMDETLSGSISALKQHAEDAAKSVRSVNDVLVETSAYIEPIYTRAIEQAEITQDRFEKLRGGFQSTTDSNLAKLQQIGSVFDERLESLKAGADDASSILRDSSDHLKSRVEDIETAARSASEKMRDISSTLADQSADIHLTTDQALLKVETVQKAVNDQFHELSESVGRAVAQLQDAGEEFVRQARSLETSTDTAASGFARAGMVAREEGERLGHVADENAKQAQSLVASLQRETEQLLARTNDSLTELRKAGDSFAIRAREVAEQMKGALQTSESYNRQLRTQASTVAEASAETAERLSKSVNVLIGKVQDIGNAANDATGNIEKTRQSLSKESERLLSISTAALEAARNAALTFGKQSESLFKASQDAAQHVSELKKSELRGQREAFMSSAKFIIESLHSLSVDLTRMAEGEISEKTWKAFQKGDIAAFTRRLVEMQDRMPLDKARGKFARDTEFRTYVQRFIRQFEELYDQAVENDHGSILAAALGSSEVGKLYDFLCHVAGRDSKLNKTPLKAA